MSMTVDGFNTPTPPRTCIAQRLVSPLTERVYVVLSTQIAAEMQRWVTAHGARLVWEDLGHFVVDDMHDFERMEAVLQALAQRMGQRYEAGTLLAPLLEAVLERLETLETLARDEAWGL